MDDELIKQLLQGEIFWYETRTNCSIPPTSAFLPYSSSSSATTTVVASGGNNGGGNSENNNMNKRVIGFLKNMSWPRQPPTNKEEGEKERSFRHMMNERMRREKQKRSYFDLHSMLPHGTKNDKNSIVQTATMRVKQLEWLKKELERRNQELIQAKYNNKQQGNNKIRVKIENPITSGIDSMLETLKCLKALDSKPTMIQSKFSHQQFLAVIGFETEKGAATKVEEAVNKTLKETQRQLQAHWIDQMLIQNNML